MDRVFGNLLNALSEIWRSIGIAQKVSVILIGIVALAVTVLIVYMGSRPDWQILYSGLDQKTASKIYDIVNDGGTPVKLTSAGSTIMVPRKDVYRLRLKVAGEGVAVEQSGTGWELFDDMKLGLTDRQQQVALQRAIQGELERMIKEMPGVVGCSIMLTNPKKRIFKKSASRPSASVMIVMNQGRGLNTQQVDSIKHMIASAVTGMQPQDVTISNNRGQLLSRQVLDNELAGGNSGRRLDTCRKFDLQLKEKAEAILRPIVGHENVVAMVSCDIDFDNIDRVIEKYDSEKTVVISEKIVTENNEKMGAKTPGGPTGQEVINTANPEGGSSEDKMSTESRKTSEKNYIVPKTVEKISINGARIKRITAAVTIAKKRTESGEVTSWSEEELTSFKELVTAAIGAKNYPNYNSKDIEVKEMAFQVVPTPEPVETSMADSMMFSMERFTNSPLVRPIIGVLMLGILFIVFRKYFNKTSVEGSEVGLGGVYGEDMVQQLETTKKEEAEERSELAELMDSLQEKTTASPEAVASIMENWLAADRG